jgi:hypothetical protein
MTTPEPADIPLNHCPLAQQKEATVLLLYLSPIQPLLQTHKLLVANNQVIYKLHI